jgi:hypothetical protein
LQTLRRHQNKPFRRISIRSHSALVGESFPFVTVTGAQQQRTHKSFRTSESPQPFERQHGFQVQKGGPRGADVSGRWLGGSGG